MFRSGNLKLAGTITFPAQNRQIKSPAVLLLSGAGADSRDGLGYFKTLAWFLACHGIASFRIDDRGTGQSEGTYALATLDDLATDAVAAFEYLRSTNGIDPSYCGILGHSEGAWVALLTASRDKKVRFVTALSGAGVGGTHLVRSRLESLSEQAELPLGEREIRAEIQDALITLSLLPEPIRGESEVLTAVARLAAGADAGVKFDEAMEMVRRKYQMLRQPALASRLRFDPTIYLARLDVPVLWVNGELDRTFDPRDTTGAVRACLIGRKNAASEVILWPLLGHNLACNWAYVPYIEWKGNQSYSPEVLDFVATWINRVR